MSLVTQVSNAMTTIGTVTKALRQTIGSLASLTTTTKTDIVSAINEVKASVGGAGVSINDTTASVSTVYSSQKTEQKITAAITALINGAPGALDTLKEITDQLAADESAAASLTTAVSNRLRFDAAQSLTGGQKDQAATNGDYYRTGTIGDPATDFAGAFTTANT